MKKTQKTLTLCGIDEAGRGPLAGSLVIAGVILKEYIDGLTDSKKLTERARESLFPVIIANSTFHIVTYSAKRVDELGISACMSAGLREIQGVLSAESYLFDGNCTFGVDKIDTMVKADSKVAEVSAASILAKVTHDREMRLLSQQYPLYGFENNKGYGTKAHVEALKKYGRCEAHRYTFHVKSLGES